MEHILVELVEKLQKAHSAALVSVILYGSAATAEQKDAFSDFNVLCVLRQVTPVELEASEPVFLWWRSLENPSPLLLSELEVQNSTDCFPIEFHDMKERRRVLYGIDVIAPLDIDYAFYRAQVEHELRAKLLRLRQKAGSVLSNRELLLKLMADSLSTFCVLFRHGLLLDGAVAEFDKRGVVLAAKERFGLDPAPFLTLIDLREQKTKAKDVEPSALFREYLKQIESMVDTVDRLKR
jgi:hypothetical protein